MASIQKEDGDQAPADPTCSNKDSVLKEQKMGHRYAVRGEIHPKLEGPSRFEELIWVGEKRIVSIISLIMELTGKLDQRRLMATSIELLASQFTGRH